MSLLDYDFSKALNSDQGRLGLGLLAAAAPSNQGFGQRLQSALGYVQGQQDRDTQKQMQQVQMQDLIAQAAARKREAEKQAKADAMAQSQQDWRAGLPNVLNAKVYGSSEYGPTMESDRGALDNYLMQPNSPFADEVIKAKLFPKPEEAFTLGEGQVRYKGDKVIAQGPEKKPDLPSAVREYEYAKGQGYQGSFNDFQTQQKRAGASNISLKVDNKMGESLASQVGPMLKDSTIQTQGAMKMFDAADRLGKALDSNLVTAGPFASKIQTAKQLAQVIGGGNDQSIRQTQQAIRSLAQMAVEARKQLQGQGQVTETEAAAVARADAGDIDGLTTGELRDLVTLTKRAAHLQAKAHAEKLSNLSSKEETKGLVPFYNIRGVEPLLQHNPELPNIGGRNVDVRSKADAIIGIGGK